MTVRKTTDIFCDGCTNWAGQTGGLQGETAAELRKELRYWGWVRKDGLDLCVACVKGGLICFGCGGSGVSVASQTTCEFCEGDGVLPEEFG